jgi:hypothetical protein
MPAPKFTVTVRDDGPSGARTVMFHDEDGVDLGSLVVDAVPLGLRVEAWNDLDQHVGQILLRRTPR